MRGASLSLIACLALAPARGQAITVTGKVTDAAGKPVSGAVVTLLNARLADTTASDGSFDFTGKSNALVPRLHRAPAVSWRSGGFAFTLPAGGRLDARLYDVRGGEVARVFRGVIAPGAAFVPFPRLPASAAALRLSHDGVTETYALPVPGAARRGNAAALRRSAAASDWLQAYKPGYAPAAKAIDDYAGAYDLVLSPADGPDFGPNVILFDPSQPTAAMQARIDAVHAKQANAQFGIDRYCFLFKPGAYSLNVDIDYYTQAAGLGLSPEDVAIGGPVRSITATANNNVTLMFWRACENMSAAPSGTADIWAVSQGASMRRMRIKGNLALSLGGWASGGFLADTQVDKDVGPGSQQQWYTRNSEIGSFTGGVWNMSFTGVTGAPAMAWPAKPYTVVAASPVLREKPFLTIDKTGAYSVFVPAVRKDAIGTSWSRGPAAGESIPIGMFYIAHPDADNASSMNAALAGGKHLLLTPGIYHLDKALEVARPGTVLLGLGLANLIADNGTAALHVADVDGVKIAGILIDAGAVESPTLLQVGEPGGSADHSADPTSLHDVFIRVGGPRPGSVQTAVVIHSNDVIGDHFWIWRADHGTGVGWNGNKGRNGLLVEGDRVTFYGLFVEHFQEYQTIWNGENGRTYFYQSEMPYDPPSQDQWQHDGVKGWASYKVGADVKTHEAWGLGVYCAFRAGPIQSDRAVEAPAAPGVQVRHVVAVWLNGVDGSGINNVLNAMGGAVTKTKARATVD